VEGWSSILVGLLLFAVGAWLMHSHVRTWRTMQQQKTEMEPRERNYRLRQFRRRTQTSAMLGLLGVAILLGHLLSVLSAPPLLMFIFWGGVMLMAVWLGLLAVADMIATRQYFSRLKQDYLIQQARLQAELRRLQRTRDDGRPDKDEAKKQTEIGHPDQAADDEPSSQQQ
jgi:hypothetical protein